MQSSFACSWSTCVLGYLALPRHYKKESLLKLDAVAMLKLKHN